MKQAWQNFLATEGATWGDGAVRAFGNVETERRAAREGAVLCDLSHLGIIRVAGEDSARFLQGQFSNDINVVTPTTAQLSSYNTPKGRMLASFLVWQQDDIFLQLHGSLVEAMLKRLSMYVLRAKVKLSNANDDYVAMGLGGPGAVDVLKAAGFPVPNGLWGVSQEAFTTIHLPGDLYVVICASESASALWQQLARHAQPAGREIWEWLQIRAGLPTVTAATQDEFVPQMLNFDLLGGINFKKGCYPGQEIVARTQYLGKLKRRTYLCHIDEPHRPAPGDALFSADLVGQATGAIVNVAPAPEGGYDFLAVVQMESAATQTLHWQSLDGPAVERREMPYTV